MTETQFFCAERSRQSGVNIIGSASEHQVYIAIECPPPWTGYDLDSKGIPDNLRELSDEIDEEYDRFQARFLLIHNDYLKQENLTRLLIFRKPLGLASAYTKQEFHLANIQDVAPLVKQYLMNEPLTATPIEITTRDILICTHGSRDRCCARFGNSLYRDALQIVGELSLDQVRIWQVSHIGGHRMAPTAIDFPEARYYGFLDRSSLTSILTRTGDIQDLKTVYRGWGVLPWAAQVVEKELLLTHGWDWFDNKAAASVLEHDEEETFNCIELTCETAAGDRQIYRADVVADPEHAVFLKSSCASEKESEVVPYAVKNLMQVQGNG
jgi:hypothetical protein